jgi:hypothetical protein
MLHLVIEAVGYVNKKPADKGGAFLFEQNKGVTSL